MFSVRPPQQIRFLRALTAVHLRKLYAKVCDMPFKRRPLRIFRCSREPCSASSWYTSIHNQTLLPYLARAYLAIQQAEQCPPAFDSKEVKHRSTVRAEALPETIHLKAEICTEQYLCISELSVLPLYLFPWIAGICTVVPRARPN